jgi:pteridine reductase
MNESAPVALVTGAANRIGATIARVLHAAGYRVIVHYRNSAAAAQKLATELNAQRAESACCVRADLAKFAQLAVLAEASVECWNRLDLLVNNASSFYPTPLGEIDEGDWHDLMNSNARAPLFLSKHLYPALLNTRGCIVNIVDSTALDGVAGFTPYTMAKAALANMTRSLARELAPEVRVNGVSPGAILWPEYAGGVDEEEKQSTLAHTALGRMGTPEDIAHAVLFLARDATYVTGQVIAVDGGV